MKTCSYPGCDRPHEARGWCHTHYARWKRHGNVNPRGVKNIGRAEYMWSRFVKDSVTGCWLWTGTVSRGYGVASTGPAYRVMYELVVGPVSSDLEVDHLCRNRLCINPSHLEAVMASENQQRTIPYRLKTHCKNGHLMEGSNLATKSDGRRRCRTCHATEQRERKRRLAKEKCGL